MIRQAITITIAFISILFAQELKFVGSISSPDGPHKGDRFGTYVAYAGDINGDGYGDMLVCADGKFSQDPNYHGKVYVYLGGKKLNDKPYMVLRGQAPGDRFGASAAWVGDINDDGIDDFAVGAPNCDFGGTDAGRVYIFYGGKKLDSIPDIVIDGKKVNGWFGSSIAGGFDINGDNKPDLLVGAQYGGPGVTGEVYVYLGGMGFDKAALTLRGENTVDGFGARVAMLGDVTGDGIADFAVSAIYYDLETAKNVGKVYVYKGGSIISKEPAVTYIGKLRDENLGYVVCSPGDVNNDGYDDIMVGAPGGAIGSYGAVYIFPGGKTLKSEYIASYIGESVNSLFGYSASGCGDINGDKIPDFMVGSPYLDVEMYHTGRVSFFAGGKMKSTEPMFTVDGDSENAQCGYCVSVIKDFFGKGKDAFAICCAGPGSGLEGKGLVRMYKK